MTSSLFLGFLAGVALSLAVLCARFLPRRATAVVFIALPTWLLYVGLLAYFGVVPNPALRPPGMVYILLPVLIFVLLFVVRSPAGGRVAIAIPLSALLAFQVYRVGVELFLHELWREGLVPRMLTFEGANFDILIGASAPVIAWLASRGPFEMRLAFIWNALGLVSLANVVIRSALTAPGPLHILHSEVPNLAIGTFPYTFIPGFLAPLAVVLHVFAIRSLRRRLSKSAPLRSRIQKEAAV
jgi:hypothetical protein